MIHNLGIPFEAKKLDTSKGEHETESVKRITPTGMLPAIKQGDFSLSRSQAICRYLILEECKTTEFYPDDDIKTKSKIDSYLDYDIMDLRDAVKKMTKLHNHQTDPAESAEALAAGFEKGINLLKLMVERSSGKYLIGNHVTLADFSIFTSIYEAVVGFGFNLSSHPEIKTWYENVSKIQEVKDVVSEFK